ncbi:MAG: hypothetical protein PHG48_08700, partial [Eubacteriales bacterium]|nr:hypothetical protein [Eubacteriales bacterium]
MYKISWTCKADVENNENIAFQIRSADTAEGIDDAEWKGPDNGTDSYTYISKSGEMLADPGVEAGGDGGESPVNVKERYYGSAKPVFTCIIDAADRNNAYENSSLYMSDVYEGNCSVKVEYPEWEQGSSARWEVVYDGGIIPDRDYLFSVWHRESGGIGNLNLFVG